MGQQHPSVTPLAIAVLALLDERPMHPYEMYQTLVARHEDKLVKVRPGSLYHTVARLAEHDLVRSEGVERAGNRPERTTYRITRAGRRVMQERIAEIVRRPLPEYPLLPIALGELHNLPADDVLALLRERVARRETELAETDMMIAWAGEHVIPRRYWIVLPFLRTMLVAEIDWLLWLIGELDSGALEWNEFDPETGERVAAYTPVPSVPRDTAAQTPARAPVSDASS